MAGQGVREELAPRKRLAQPACERKKRATEALAYNGLVQSWPEITRLAREGVVVMKAKDKGLFEEEGGE